MMPRFRDQLRSVRIRPWQKLWQAWAPTGDEKERWIAKADQWYTTSVLTDPALGDDKRLAYVTAKLRDEAMGAGVGPLTWLWIASMVIELIKLWREWKENK
jgi:hypothetical protein